MRELTLLETSYLAVGLLLSLLLPLLMSFRGSERNTVAKRSCLTTVWSAQAVLALAGLAVISSAPIAPYAAALGLMGWVCCALLLLRQFRAV